MKGVPLPLKSPENLERSERLAYMIWGQGLASPPLVWYPPLATKGSKEICSFFDWFGQDVMVLVWWDPSTFCAYLSSSFSQNIGIVGLLVRGLFFLRFCLLLLQGSTLDPVAPAQSKRRNHCVPQEGGRVQGWESVCLGVLHCWGFPYSNSFLVSWFLGFSVFLVSYFLSSLVS